MSTWRHCSTCRASIEFEQIYWECSVSTCARMARTGLFFCSVGCWEAHLPTMRHREAWAVEKRAPDEGAWRRAQEETARAEGAGPREPRAEPPRRDPGPATAARTEVRRQVIAPPQPAASAGSRAGDDTSDEILIVVTKLKKYVRARSGMNTSDGVMAVLSDHLRHVCDLAIRKAAEEGRKTVLDRDFKAIL
jgi:hypothetical protein